MPHRILAVMLALTLTTALLLCGCSGNGLLASSAAASSRSQGTTSSPSSLDPSASVTSDVSETDSQNGSAASPASKPDPAETPARASTMTRLAAFYAPKQAVSVYTVDVSELDRDTVDMLRTLQGLLARCDSAALYLVGSDADRFWRTYASNEMGIYFQQATVEQLLDRFGKQIGGVMLYTPDTYEYEVAFDRAMLADGVIATAEVARRYGLSAYGRVTDLRGAFADRQKAYTDLIARLPQAIEYVYLLGDSRAFADYAYAVHAPALRLTGEEAWESSLLAQLAERERVTTPTVVFTDGSALQRRYEFSAAGLGLLNVSGFGNATFFASATTTRRFTPKQPSVSAAAPDGTASLTFLLTPASVGDALTTDYAVWRAQDGSVPVSYVFPVALAELAPLVMGWYQAAAADGNRLVADGWCDIDEKAVPYDVYRKWHGINNELMAACGLDLAVTDALREDTIYGESFGSFSTAAGIFVTDGSGDGSVWRSKNTPVVVTVNVRSLTALDAWLASVSAARRPLYYAVALSVPVFSQPYQLLPTDPAAEPTTLTFAQVVKDAVQAPDSILRLVTAENLIEAGRHE